jgi:hypothetical protein
MTAPAPDELGDTEFGVPSEFDFEAWENSGSASAVVSVAAVPEPVRRSSRSAHLAFLCAYGALELRLPHRAGFTTFLRELNRSASFPSRSRKRSAPTAIRTMARPPTSDGSVAAGEIHDYPPNPFPLRPLPADHPAHHVAGCTLDSDLAWHALWILESLPPFNISLLTPLLALGKVAGARAVTPGAVRCSAWLGCRIVVISFIESAVRSFSTATRPR